jgi:hypothetical protein
MVHWESSWLSKNACRLWYRHICRNSVWLWPHSKQLRFNVASYFLEVFAVTVLCVVGPQPDSWWVCHGALSLLLKLCIIVTTSKFSEASHRRILLLFRKKVITGTGTHAMNFVHDDQSVVKWWSLGGQMMITRWSKCGICLGVKLTLKVRASECKSLLNVRKAIMYIYTYTYTHTHTHIYIYIYHWEA